MSAAWSWFASHVAGGLVTAVLVGGGHLVLTRRYLRKVTGQQTAELKNSSGKDGS